VIDIRLTSGICLRRRIGQPSKCPNTSAMTRSAEPPVAAVSIPSPTNKHIQFLTSLTTLLTSTHASSHGSVFLTQKPMPSTETSESSRTLIRASNGKSKIHRNAKSGKSPKIKLSTVVEAEDLSAFYAKYAEACKKGMEGLRKRDKKKAKAKRKKKTAGADGGEVKKVG